MRAFNAFNLIKGRIEYTDKIKASCAAKTIIVGWNYGYGVEVNHEIAANKLFMSLNLDVENKLIGGQLKDGSYVFVLVEVSK